MLFAFYMIDNAGMADVRLSVRPAHKEYLGAVEDRIAFAGPLLTDDGKTMEGSLLVLNFDSREQAEQWLKNEPFTKAGLYARTELRRVDSLWPQRAGK